MVSWNCLLPNVIMILSFLIPGLVFIYDGCQALPCRICHIFRLLSSRIRHACRLQARDLFLKPRSCLLFFFNQIYSDDGERYCNSDMLVSQQYGSISNWSTTCWSPTSCCHCPQLKWICWPQRVEGRWRTWTPSYLGCCEAPLLQVIKSTSAVVVVYPDFPRSSSKKLLIISSPTASNRLRVKIDIYWTSKCE